MSKSRRVERLRERSQERFNRWMDTEDMSGAQAKRDLKKHQKLEDKVKRIEAKDQTNEKPKPSATSRPRGGNEFSGSEKINAESKKRLDEIQSQYAERMKATDVIAANAKKRRGQHITVPGLGKLKGLAGTQK